MQIEQRRRTSAVLAACATGLVALVALQPATASPNDLEQSPRRVATVAVVTTYDFRVAVSATRSGGGSAPTAEVQVGVARRVDGRWVQIREERLRETYFWHTLSGPRAVCRLEVGTTGGRRTAQPHVVVQLLLSPSLGCARAYRIPLAPR